MKALLLRRSGENYGEIETMQNKDDPDSAPSPEIHAQKVETHPVNDPNALPSPRNHGITDTPPPKVVHVVPETIPSLEALIHQPMLRANPY